MRCRQFVRSGENGLCQSYTALSRRLARARAQLSADVWGCVVRYWQVGARGLAIGRTSVCRPHSDCLVDSRPKTPAEKEN